MTKTKHLQNHLSKPKNPKFNCSSSSYSLLADYNFLKTASLTVDPDQRKARVKDFKNPNLKRAHVKSKRVMLLRDSVALTTYSMEPREDFRQSMMEMVRSRIEQNLAVDWNYMEELVNCFLELNDVTCDECIWNAFTKVVAEVVSYQRLHSI
ncbi:hypothetical protein Ddye_007687 [Dipteronia dyeriana]|uniref:Transcription repressor n=1 Tax=Dipteronia dyeriana TaxID=168575 RepID=A0AAD9XKF2_9ROSI|nr:hypothetical protein Ddye_007687 [Dipteronia dyeriana]